MSKGTDSGTDTDSLETSDLGIGTNGTPEGNDIGEESEHVDKRRGDHTSLSESSSRLVETGCTFGNCSSTITTFG